MQPLREIGRKEELQRKGFAAPGEGMAGCSYLAGACPKLHKAQRVRELHEVQCVTEGCPFLTSAVHSTKRRVGEN
eukprot:scaffold226338_cov21-Tisochrysis_lutea.AAC.1